MPPVFGIIDDAGRSLAGPYEPLNGTGLVIAEPALQRQQFGGTIAPVLKIEIEGNVTRLLGRA